MNPGGAPIINTNLNILTTIESMLSQFNHSKWKDELKRTPLNKIPKQR